jgi:hypothetical protein
MLGKCTSILCFVLRIVRGVDRVLGIKHGLGCARLVADATARSDQLLHGSSGQLGAICRSAWLSGSAVGRYCLLIDVVWPASPNWGAGLSSFGRVYVPAFT